MKPLGIVELLQKSYAKIILRSTQLDLFTCTRQRRACYFVTQLHFYDKSRECTEKISNAIEIYENISS